MTRYLFRRSLSSLVALTIFLLFMFFATEIIIPNDFTTQYAMSMNRARREQLAEELGIDRPLPQRFALWLGRILRGSLGTSFYGMPVIDVIKGLLPYTLLVFFIGTMIAFFFGQWLGKVTAWQGPGPIASLATVGSITLYTAFPPWLAFLVTYFLARRLNWLRAPYSSNRLHELNRGVWQASTFTPHQVMLYLVATFISSWLLLLLLNRFLRRTMRRTLPLLFQVLAFGGILVGTWFLLGFGPEAYDVLAVAAIPIITYVLLSFGETTLIMRTSMTDTLKEEYITTARAKGLPEGMVRDRHAARNALLPVFSRLVVSFPYLLTGLVIIESTLDWPGLSSALFDSLYNQDMPVVMGGLLMVGVLSALARLLLDLLYAYLDPRIRYGAERPGRTA